MGIEILPNVDVSYLNRLLIPAGKIHPISYRCLEDVPVNHIRAWCVKNGVYQIPTLELIDWLRWEIGDRRAIEIGAGRSCLGRHLGIIMVDNAMQTWPMVELVYSMMGQAIAKPDEDVLRMDANVAVEHFQPQVVLGAWITQKSITNHDNNIFGPNEHRILRTGCTYIHIGNEVIHGGKTIRIREHRELWFPWLISRSKYQQANRIWIWDAA